MPFTSVGSSLLHATRAVYESLPCVPRARTSTSTSTSEPPIELDIRASAQAGTAPRQPLDGMEKNMRRMRLRRMEDGELKLKQLKFGDPSSSSRPEQERNRPIEDNPLRASDLRTRLSPLSPDQPVGERQFVLSESHDVKAVGFNDAGRPAATTGTSKPNVLCVTDGMGPCIAVALGAERIAEDGITRLPGAKARVLHNPPMVAGLPETLKERVEGYMKEGLTVSAALHGGWHFNEFMAEELRSQLTGLGVTLAFDESCEKRGKYNTPLGAVVQDDHTVRFVTDLKVRP